MCWSCGAILLELLCFYSDINLLFCYSAELIYCFATLRELLCYSVVVAVLLSWRVSTILLEMLWSMLEILWSMLEKLWSLLEILCFPVGINVLLFGWNCCAILLFLQEVLCYSAELL